MVELLQRVSVLRGHHIFRSIWSPSMEETLIFEQEEIVTTDA